MARTLTISQLHSIETTERVASCLSLLGTSFVMLTFMSSPAFRKPINRLIFYATCGNTVSNAATLMSLSGIRAGGESHLCQLQGFLIQMSIPADALWNLAMAINVYLTLFRKYNAQQLKALEWRYHVMCNGAPFIVALVYVFIETEARGKMYGPAVLWCWVSIEWAEFRIALCYGPAWICMIIAFSIYTMAGREIFMKRGQLRAFSQLSSHPIDIENPFTSFKTTEVHITSELAPLPNKPVDEVSVKLSHGCPDSDRGYDRYTVTIAAAPMSTRLSMPSTACGDSLAHRQHRAAMEANTAAWGYTKIALLFFISLLVTWVPSSINRVYSLIYPDRISMPFTYASCVVLPLMGFWNSVIYTTTSWPACKQFFHNISACTFRRRNSDDEGSVTRRGWGSPDMSEHESVVAPRKSGGSVSDSMRALARGYGV